MKKQWTVSDFEKEVRRLDPKIKSDDPCFKTGVVLLVSLMVGANADRVAKFCKYSRDFVRPRARRARKNGIWQYDTVSCDWFDKKSGGVAFWLDVMTAEGILKRRPL
jgi:hypothetical protein